MFRFEKTLLCIWLTLALTLAGAALRAAEEDEPEEPETPAGATEEPVELRPDLAYWRGAAERSPGPFLCLKPAAAGVLVTCDRWPDASDLRRFVADAVRLSGARTEQEKALAVWRWIRRFKVHTDGNSPCEPLAQAETSYVTDPVKVLNVYGAHFCGGLSRAIELAWRSAGYRAERIHCGSHSMAELFYRDADGVVRGHLFDTNFGGFMFHSSRQRLMGVGEYGTDYAGGKTSWVHCDHWPWPTHRMELALRKGEKLERLWSNLGKPYQAHMDPKRDTRRTPLAERGPYADRTYGNGVWEYSPDPADPAWLDGLAEPPKGLAAGRLAPAAPGRPASAVWHFRTPYIVSDLELQMRAVRRTPDDVVRLLVSVDDGRTWNQLWQMTESGEKPVDVKTSVCPKFEVKSLGGSGPPREFHSPFGSYAFRIKLEMIAKENTEGCRVEALSFRTTVQQNYYALPQLQPGRNRITVRGELAPGAALRVTYVWDDPEGQGRRNVTVVEKTPYEYEILAAGKQWKDCVSRSIAVEAVAATGKGNRTEEKEKPSEVHQLPADMPVADTRGRRGWWIRAEPAKSPPAEKLVATIESALTELEKVEAEKKKPEADRAKLAEREGEANGSISGALKYLLELRSPQAFGAARRTVYLSRDGAVKEAAMVAMFLCDREKARPVLLDVLQNPAKVAWTERPIKRGPQNADQHWAWAAVQIAVLAETAGWKEFTPGLVKVLESGHATKHCPHAILRVLAAIGDQRALPAVREALKGKGYAAGCAALAAAQLGDGASVGAVRKLLAGGTPKVREFAAIALGRLKDGASAGELRKLLASGDEGLRAAGAEALGEMRDSGSLGALRAAHAAEPFPWVREKMGESIAKLGGNGK